MLERLYRHPGTRTKPKAWYVRDDGLRLSYDKKLLAQAFPGLAYRIDEQKECVFLEGTIELVAECGISTPIQVSIVFPYNYPDGEPLVYDAASCFPHDADRHFYSDGQCCLWFPPESRWNKKDQDALSHFLDQVVVFFDQQLIYDATGRKKWPGRQRGHGLIGYIEYIQEQLGVDQQRINAFIPMFSHGSGNKRNRSCPCGSGYKYKKCHLSIVQEIGRKVGTIHIQRIVKLYHTNSSPSKQEILC